MDLYTSEDGSTEIPLFEHTGSGQDYICIETGCIHSVINIDDKIKSWPEVCQY